MATAAPPSTRVEHFGQSRVPVLIVDGVDRGHDEVLAHLAALAPFPPDEGFYPGTRLRYGPQEPLAEAYLRPLLTLLVPLIAKAFGVRRIVPAHAAFSQVTTPPDRLAPMQRRPHFDGLDPQCIAILHYLAPCEGTAFFRHRASGLERVTTETIDAYLAMVHAEPVPPGYICGSNEQFAMTGSVEGRAGRIVAYPSNVLHSGLIGPDFFAADGRPHNRLTANVFVQAAL